MPDLQPVARSIAELLRRRQRRIDERAVGLDDAVFVVDVAPVNAVFRIENVIEPDKFLPEIARERRLKSDVLTDRRVVVARRESDHRAVYVGDRDAVRRDSI